MLALTLGDRVCIVANLTNGLGNDSRVGFRSIRGTPRAGMRWYVDISTIGPDKPTQRHCVEAEQWQKALQGVRASRGDDAPFGNFSIELLDDGYRAIDPMTRTRYVVQRAPDGTPLTQEPTLIAAKGAPATSSQAAPASPPAARPSDPKAASPRASRPRPSARGERAAPAARTSERGRTRGKAPSIPDDVVPRTAAPVPAAVDAPAAKAPVSEAPEAAPRSLGPNSAPVTAPRPSQQPIPSAAIPPTEPNRPSQAPGSAPRPASLPPDFTPARPMQAETAFERMTGGAGVVLGKPSPTADIPTEVLPAHKVLSRRSEDPTPSSPLTYREMAISVADTTSLRDAEAIARAQFEVVRNALAGAPKGKFIQLAVFDHEFTGKPKKVPIVTLAFKDWRDQEPVIAFPQRDGVATRRSSERPSAAPGTVESSRGASAGFPASYPPSSIVPVATAAPVSVAPAPVSAPAARPSEPAAPPAAAEAAPSANVPAAEPEPASEPIKPTPVIAITDEPMLVRQVPQAQQGATLLERPQPTPAEIPAPTPSQIKRDAKEMAGEDERTLVKQSAPPPAPSAEELSDSDIQVDIPPPPAAALQPATERIPTIPPPTGVAPKREPTSEPPPQAVPIPAPNRTERMAVPAPGSESANGAPAKPAHLVPPESSAQPSVPPPQHASVPPPAGTDPNFSARGQFPAATVPSQPPPAPDAQAQRVPSIPPAASPQSQHPSAPPPAPARASATPAPLPQQNGGLSIKAPRGKRKGGDDLITDLFEACSDLGFVHDALEGADFVLDLVFESIPNTCTLISFFDINAREFVVVRQGVAASAAETLQSVLLGRTSEFTKLVQKTMRAGRASVIPSAATAALGEDPRFRNLGAEPQSFICAPIVAGGRYLGMIEVLDPLDGAPFTDGDGHALTYIGEQFAEFLSQRDLLLDPERVTRPRLSQQARR